MTWQEFTVFMMFRSTGSYEPDHSWSLDRMVVWWFRSTGSYEPDRKITGTIPSQSGFDPQALTSLTFEDIQIQFVTVVSIHRLLRA